MAHQTRSGKVFRKHTATEQISFWAEDSEVLQAVLGYLDLDSALKCRQVCKAWRDSFSTVVKKLQLHHLASYRAALKLGRKAAAAFGTTTTVRLHLLSDPEPIFDLTAEQPQLIGPDSISPQAAAAGATLLRQLSKAGCLQQLQLVSSLALVPCTFLPVLVKAAPQLRVLDLSCCSHRSEDLPLLPQHATGLQELLLHCQAFTTLSGRKTCWGSREWHKLGGNTDYSPKHLAALAGLRQLKLLELPLPSLPKSERHYKEWFMAVGSLNSLTGLHAMSHAALHTRPSAAAMTSLSRLAQLRELRCDAGRTEWTWGSGTSEGSAAYSLSEATTQAECWGLVLPCMTQLTRLELIEAAAGDPLLCAIGDNAPQLQRLVLDKEVWHAESSKQGADAIAHVGHLELVCHKGFACSKNSQVLQLPGLKRVYFAYAALVLGGRARKGGAWTPETCFCEECAYKNRDMV